MDGLKRLTRRDAATLMELIEQARCCDHNITGLDRLFRSLGGLVPYCKLRCSSTWMAKYVSYQLFVSYP